MPRYVKGIFCVVNRLENYKKSKIIICGRLAQLKTLEEYLAFFYASVLCKFVWGGHSFHFLRNGRNI